MENVQQYLEKAMRILERIHNEDEGGYELIPGIGKVKGYRELSNFLGNFVNSIISLSMTAWRSDMEGHPEKCVERHCEFAQKSFDQLHKDSAPCLDDHQIKTRRHGVSWRMLRDMLSNCLEVLMSWW